MADPVAWLVFATTAICGAEMSAIPDRPVVAVPKSIAPDQVLLLNDGVMTAPVAAFKLMMLFHTRAVEFVPVALKAT